MPADMIGRAVIEILPDIREFARSLVTQVAGATAALSGGLNTALRATSERLSRVGRQMTQTGYYMSLNLTFPLVAVGAAALRMSTDFERSMALITGLVNVPRAQVQAWEDDVRRLAIQFGRSANEAAQALYFITSSGIGSTRAIQTLTIALKGSASGLGDTQVLADLLTSAMNAYARQGLTAARATDILTAAVREGKLEPAALAANIAHVLPIAASMGVTFEEVSAAMATMSLTGTSAGEATTQLRSLLDALAKPSKQAIKILERYGLTAGDLRRQLGEEGLVAVLRTLQSTVGRNTEDLFGFLGRIEATSGVVQLSAGNFKTFERVLGGVTNSTGSLDYAFKTIAETSAFKLDQSVVRLKDSLIDFGAVLAPVLTDIAGKIAFLTDKLDQLSPAQRTLVVEAGLILAVTGPLLTVIGSLTTVLGAVLSRLVLVAGGVQLLAKGVSWLLVPGRILTGVVLGLNNALIGLGVATSVTTRILATLVTVIRSVILAARILAFTIAAALAIPVGVVAAIVVAITAIGIAFFIAYKKSETFRNIVNGVMRAVRDFVVDAWHWIRDAAITTWDAIRSGAAAGLNALRTAWTTIGNVARSVWNGITAGAQAAWNVLKIVWNGIVTGVHLVGAVLNWLWQNVAVPVWNGIITAARVAGAVLVSIFKVVAFGARVLGTIFRFIYTDFIKPAWLLITLAVQIAWVAIRITFGLIEIAIVVLGRAFTWIWRSVVVPAWNGIGGAISWTWNNVVKPVWNQLVAGVKQLGQWANWLWRNVVIPAWNGIGSAISWAWNNVIKPVWNFIVGGFKLLGQWANWLWLNVIVPVWNGIRSVIQITWNSGIKPVWNHLVTGVREIARWAMWLWRNVIVPVWNGIGGAISAVWRRVIAPVFNALSNFIMNTIPAAFRTGVDAIAAAWNAVKDVAKIPVRFIVETVINRGIIDTYNRIRHFFGMGTKGDIGHIALPRGFARGGVFDRPVAIVGEGGPHPEYVIPTDPKHRKRAIGLYEDLGAKLMQAGGILDWIPGFSGIKRSIDRVRELGNSPWAQLVTQLPRQAYGWVVDKIKSFITSGIGKFIGPGLEGVPQATGTNQNIVRSLAAQIYHWVGAQWSALYQLIMHESGFRNTAQNPTSTAYGMFQFLDSTWRTVGGYKTSDPRLQTIYGLSYVRQRHDDPIGAWSFWLNHHWYRNGTRYVPKTGLYGLHQGEAVVPAWLNRGGAGGDAGGAAGGTVVIEEGALQTTINVHGDVGAAQLQAIDGVVRDAFRDMLREIRTGVRR